MQTYIHLLVKNVFVNLDWLLRRTISRCSLPRNNKCTLIQYEWFVNDYHCRISCQWGLCLNSQVDLRRSLHESSLIVRQCINLSREFLSYHFLNIFLALLMLSMSSQVYNCILWLCSPSAFPIVNNIIFESNIFISPLCLHLSCDIDIS